MLLHHVEGNSLVPCRIDPKKLKWGLENCTWGILHEGKGSCAQSWLHPWGYGPPASCPATTRAPLGMFHLMGTNLPAGTCLVIQLVVVS